MVVIQTPLQATLRLVVETGVDQKGNPVYKRRAFNKVKTSASDEDVMAVATILGDLQKDTLHSVERIGVSSLAEG